MSRGSSDFWVVMMRVLLELFCFFLVGICKLPTPPKTVVFFPVSRESMLSVLFLIGVPLHFDGTKDLAQLYAFLLLLDFAPDLFTLFEYPFGVGVDYRHVLSHNTFIGSIDNRKSKQ